MTGADGITEPLHLSVGLPIDLQPGHTPMTGALKSRDRLTEDARWCVNFGLIILTVLLIAGLLVLSWHSWFPDQVQLHA